MERQTWRFIFSILLIAMGVVFLLSNLNVLPFAIDNNRIFWLSAFGVGGIAFLAALFSNLRENWWAAIPGFTLLGLAALIGLPVLWGTNGGAFFLCMIGLSFWVIYLIRREFWWSVIPGGALFTLAGVTMLAEADGLASGGFLFLGLGLTFLVVYLMPTIEGRMRWAIWPAGVLGLMGALIMSGAEGLARFVWPAVLIAIGGLLVYRAARPNQKL
jgi:hypothetical protein